jgi:epoxyqueuosine reductase QueG
VAFPYDPRPGPDPVDMELTKGQEPYLRIGAFAAAHRYAALARILKSLARDLSGLTGDAYSSFRVAVNSRLPEKRLAELSGLGCRGRSDLLLTYAYGPACILGLLLLPFDPLKTLVVGIPKNIRPGQAFRNLCESCRACVDACPGRAITGCPSRNTGSDGCSPVLSYHREACIQYWLSTNEEPPEPIRGALAGHLYGCDACILGCPVSARAWMPDRADGSSPASRADALLLPDERRPGSLISAAFLAVATDDELKACFRKTALGFSWAGPGLIRRNAALATRDASTVTGQIFDAGPQDH